MITDIGDTMNEKIKVLMMKAGMFPDDYLNEHWEKNKRGDIEAAKTFADLIIKECLKSVRSTYLPVLEDELMMDCEYWKGYVSGGVDALTEIKIQLNLIDEE